jgi:CDP-paratose 2-epimerase
MQILITGSGGLIGSGAVEYFNSLPNFKITGLDNNARKEFFGPEGSTEWNSERLKESCSNFTYLKLDIKNKEGVDYLFSKNKFDVILHFAAQPAHDYSFKNPYNDFLVNTVGTVNLLEATRVYNPEATFIFTSTSKVYGTSVNEYEFKELDTRYDYSSGWMKGIDETCSIDQTLHSMFGANKAAADIICQEYGLYFGLHTTILRPGCLTGAGHSAVELHGFLSYLIKCVIEEKEYKIYDNNGKRVRDNISTNDMATIFHEIIKSPPKPGTVYNVGGCKENSISILEALNLASIKTGNRAKVSFHQPRIGDHVVYVSDMTKFKKDYPNWKMKDNLDKIFDDIIQDYKGR